MQSFWNTLQRDEDVLMGVVFFVVLAVIIIAIVGIVQWRKLRQAEIEAALKRDLLDRGLSADEVVRVLSVGTAAPAGSVCVDSPSMRQTADYSR